jgi:hypothetical protein
MAVEAGLEVLRIRLRETSKWPDAGHPEAAHGVALDEDVVAGVDVEALAQVAVGGDATDRDAARGAERARGQGDAVAVLDQDRAVLREAAAFDRRPARSARR